MPAIGRRDLIQRLKVKEGEGCELGGLYVTKDNNDQQCNNLHSTSPPYQTVQF